MNDPKLTRETQNHNRSMTEGVEDPAIRERVIDRFRAYNGRLRAYFIGSTSSRRGWGVRVELEVKNITFVSTAWDHEAGLSNDQDTMQQKVAVAKVAADKLLSQMPSHRRKETLW